MEFTKEDRLTILENALSWVVVFNMFIYGFGKIFQFKGAASIDKVVSEMTGMELMWAFYGYSYSFALVLGAMEVLGALLLLFRQTRLLGCLFLSAILVNIILQDIFYGVHVGALKAALLYQFLLLVILWMNRQQVIAAFQQLLIKIPFPKLNKKTFALWLLAFLLFTAFRLLEYYVTIKWP